MKTGIYFSTGNIIFSSKILVDCIKVDSLAVEKGRNETGNSKNSENCETVKIAFFLLIQLCFDALHNPSGSYLRSGDRIKQIKSILDPVIGLDKNKMNK